MKTLSDRHRSRVMASPNGGFSLIEVMVAALLLLVIALGLVPLFTRAMIDNANGRDSTTSTNFNRSQLESLAGLPFDSNTLTVADGQPFTTTSASYSRGTLNLDNDSSEGWVAGVPANLATVRWTRQTRVTYYPASDFRTGALTNGRVGGSSLAFYQLKLIQVTVQGANSSLTRIGNILGGSPPVSFSRLVGFS